MLKTFKKCFEMAFVGAPLLAGILTLTTWLGGGGVVNPFWWMAAYVTILIDFAIVMRWCKRVHLPWLAVAITGAIAAVGSYQVTRLLDMDLGWWFTTMVAFAVGMWIIRADARGLSPQRAAC